MIFRPKIYRKKDRSPDQPPKERAKITEMARELSGGISCPVRGGGGPKYKVALTGGFLVGNGLGLFPIAVAGSYAEMSLMLSRLPGMLGQSRCKF